MTTTLGTYIRQRRQELGLSQEQLAERIGESVSQSDVSRLEKDRITLPRRRRMEQLAVALEVSLGELFVRTGWMEDENQLGSLATGIAPKPTVVQDSNPVDTMAAMLEGVAAMHAMIEDAARVLEQAKQSMASLMRALDAETSVHGSVRPKLHAIHPLESLTRLEA